ncbi:MAG: ParB/RepB/Spo0J family partition protein [Syntrophobacteraceae bacterium]|nr:ParB/RepB/Spo0J family partition protein [Desulfobacteraceae bacterium]
MTAEKNRGLGRGLDDLLSSTKWLKSGDLQLFYCPTDSLEPNPCQPRQTVEDEPLQQLVQSVREKGILQPILVSRSPLPDRYTIIAGERRWRAATLAGLAEVPVILREASSSEALEFALIENLQRQDLNAIEEALAFQRLQQEFNLTQEEISQRVGKNRATIANTLRLLNLPAEIQQHVIDHKLAMGHARALLALPDPVRQLRVCASVISRGLSVRETERLVAKASAEPAPSPPPDPDLEKIQDRLRSRLESPVRLRRSGDRGTITIPFTTPDELSRLLRRLGLDNE